MHIKRIINKYVLRRKTDYKTPTLIIGGALVVLLILSYLIFRSDNLSIGSIFGIPQGDKTQPMAIRTDKQMYNPGEPVNISIRSGYGKQIRNNTDSGLTIYGDPRMGRNYGVALIEYYAGGSWQAIEPVWRCDSKCFESCREGPDMNPGETRTFVWDQSRHICDLASGEMESLGVEAGRYRVSSAAWNGAKNSYEIIHSNDFAISGK